MTVSQIAVAPARREAAKQRRPARGVARISTELYVERLVVKLFHSECPLEPPFSLGGLDNMCLGCFGGCRASCVGKRREGPPAAKRAEGERGCGGAARDFWAWEICSGHTLGGMMSSQGSGGLRNPLARTERTRGERRLGGVILRLKGYALGIGRGLVGYRSSWRGSHRWAANKRGRAERVVGGYK